MSQFDTAVSIQSPLWMNPKAVILVVLSIVGFFFLLFWGFSETPPSPAQTYRVTIDYDRPLAKLTTAGKYDFVNPALRNFALESSGPATVDIRLITINPDAGRPDATTAKEFLERNGYRPATVRELLALGEAYPTLSKGVTIIALGTPWVTTNGHSVVVALEGLGQGNARRIEACGAGVLCFRENISFAAVPKP